MKLFARNNFLYLKKNVIYDCVKIKNFKKIFENFFFCVFIFKNRFIKKIIKTNLLILNIVNKIK